ncbi:MAG: glycosyltransferase family 4 protein [Opitutales bacterium]|nr:glycosyltransferase family 4 protein [Opitutales bacterium]
MSLYSLLLVPALFAMELIYFKIADRFNIVDKPNARSSHTTLTRRGGGIIFLLAAVWWSAAHGFAFPWFLGGLVLIAGISFVDDLVSVSNKIRLLCHFAAFAMMFHEWTLFSTFPWWISVVALIFCVGIINAYNFMDGINGITGGYSLAVLGALAWVNFQTPFTENSLLWTMIAAVLVFCFFNFRKRALCFAGDVGSVAIAFVILFFLGKLMIETGDVTWIVLLLVYGVDSVLTIVHRLMLHENIGEAHRKHLYQILSNELRVPHTRVSLGYFSVQALISAGFILVAPAGTLARWAFLIVAGTLLSVFYALFMKKYFHLHLSK